MSIGRPVRYTAMGMVVVGGVLFAFWCYLQWGTGLAEHQAQVRLARQLAHRPPEMSARRRTRRPVADPYRWPTVPDGGPLARLVIPSIGLDQVVVQGTDTADLREGPGHYPATPYPGQLGNVAIAGHRTTYAHPFYDLNELVPGDVIELSVPGSVWRYRVVGSLVVSPDDVAVAGPVGEPGSWLTLTTCNPRYSASTRLVVRAQLIAPPVLPSESQVAGDANGHPVSSDRPLSRPVRVSSGTGIWPIVAWAALLGTVVGVGLLFTRRCRSRSLRVAAVLSSYAAALVLLFELFGAIATRMPTGY